MRVTVNMDDELAKKIDEHADKMHISRSAFICACCSTKMNVYFNAVTQDEIIEKLVDEAMSIENEASNYLISQKLKQDK